MHRLIPRAPGDKTYVLTLYALSAPLEPAVPPSGVTRDVLLAAMKDKVLASSELKVVYARGEAGTVHGSEPGATASTLAGQPYDQRGASGRAGGEQRPPRP